MSPTSPARMLLRRMAATAYDALVLAGVLMVTSLVLIALRGGRPVAPGTAWFQLLVLGQAAAYFTLFWARGGQTPGMRTWRLRVSAADGSPLTLAQAARRFAAAILVNAAAGLGMVWMLRDPQGRALHDRMSGSLVSEAAPAPR